MVAPADLANVLCRALCTSLGEQKVALSGTNAYNSSVESYFSQQQQALQPACIVFPETTEDVSVIIKTLTSHQGGQSNFAIRSGGHASWLGASNIAGGVVIDLQGLNLLDVHDDRSTISVGAGVSWDEVYARLDPIGLSANGGRCAEVGVSGLTLGSGLSFFSPRYGWTCDTATNFELVLADASIVQVNAESDPELFRALKGGSNNFGVVTRIDFTTFKQGSMWYGAIYHPLDVADDVISELVKICSADVYDEYSSIITSFGYSQEQGMSAVANTLVYTKEVESPPVYQGLLSLPSFMNTSQLSNMTTLSKVTRNLSPEHPRSLNRVTTLLLDTEVIKAAVARWNASLSGLSDVTNLVWSFTLEPLPPAIYSRHAKSNALGLAEGSRTLVVALISVTWTDASHDEIVTGAAKKLIDDINNDAQQLGGFNPYIFLNYADQDQDVIGSYGTASVSQLQAVQERVDPSRVFTNQVPGGYKVPQK